MNNEAPRWVLRLANLRQALSQLNSAVHLARTRKLSDLESQGLIQDFEFTHDLTWKVLKDYFWDQGDASITGSKDAIRAAFAVGLIESGDVWMAMIADRNATSHTYNLDLAQATCRRIVDQYFAEIEQLAAKLEGLVR